MMSCSIMLEETFVAWTGLRDESNGACKFSEAGVLLEKQPVESSSKSSCRESIVFSKKRRHSFSSVLRNCRSSF